MSVDEANCRNGHTREQKACTEACRRPCIMCGGPSYYGDDAGWYCVEHWVERQGLMWASGAWRKDGN